MTEFFYTFTIVAGLCLLSFVLINIRQIITGKEFRGTCATNNPLLKDKLGDCQVCGKKGDEVCKMPDPA